MFLLEEDMISEFVLAALLVFLRREILCLTDVVLDIEPKVVKKGGQTTLRCSYNLEGAPLYSVKWYRGHREFYRYTPKEHPSTKVFQYNGIHVHSEQSNEHQVVLRDVGFDLSGTFSCEVTTDAPTFSTLTVSKDLVVVVLPPNSPSISTEKSFYDIGDILKVNCTSSASRPATSLTFILNNATVCEKCVTRRHSSGELSWSESSLELPLFPSHFHDGRLTLKCVAKIRDFYQQDTEVTFDNARDPVPARVTQSSADVLQSKTFLYGLIISCIVLK